ncbi:MAG: BON domain-containing protein [Pseudomonadota bacterium]
MNPRDEDRPYRRGNDNGEGERQESARDFHPGNEALRKTRSYGSGEPQQPGTSRYWQGSRYRQGQDFGGMGSGGSRYGASGFGGYEGEGQYGGRAYGGEGPYGPVWGQREGLGQSGPFDPGRRGGFRWGAEREREARGYGGQDFRGSGSYGGHGTTGDYGYGAGPGGSWGGMQAPPQGMSGTTARRGPKGYQRSDERLKEDICERLMQAEHIDSSEVTIEVQAGRVTLEGTVPERYMKHAIEDLVDACPGVQDIDNRIRVQRPQQERSETRGQGTESGAAAGRTRQGP